MARHPARPLDSEPQPASAFFAVEGLLAAERQKVGPDRPGGTLEFPLQAQFPDLHPECRAV